MVGAAGDCTSNRFLMAWPLNKKTEKQPHAKCGARTVRVLPDASCLFLLLCPLTLAKPHAWSTSVFVDEVDPGGLKCAPYHFERGGTGLADSRFKLVHRHDANTSFLSQIQLAPCQKTSSGPALLGCDHEYQIA